MKPFVTEAPPLTELAMPAKVDGKPQIPIGQPLSAGQRRTWFLQQVDPNPTSGHVSLACWIPGTVVEKTLAQAVERLVGRHVGLHTVFDQTGGEVRQRVSEKPWPGLEVRAGNGNREEMVSRLEAAARERFDLGEGSLFRAVLWRVSRTEQVLQLVAHRLVCEDHSLVVLLAELTELLIQKGSGATTASQEWPREKSEVIEATADLEALAYWKHRLAGAPQEVVLAADRKRPGLRSSRGDQLRFPLSDSLERAVGELCRRYDTSPEIPVLAAFVLTLGRNSNQEEFCVGVPHGGVERRVGPQESSMILRVKLDRESGFGGLVKSLQREWNQAAAQPPVPFDALLEALSPPRDPSRTPLFNAGFGLRPDPARALAWTGATLRLEYVNTGCARTDLLLWLERGERMTLVFEYSTDLFEPATIQRWHGHLVTLLENGCAQPELPITGLPMLTEEERALQVQNWHTVTAPYDNTLLVLDLIADRARTNGQATALRQGGECITYAELEATSNRLARRLMRLGAGTGTRVAVFMERSVRPPVAILAILKTGAAWVPLDPNYPADRLQYMISDCNTALLFTEQSLAGRLQTGSTAVCEAETAWQDLVAENPGPLRVPVKPDSIAYVIYTSGTTGRPKGVMIEHRNLAHYVQSLRDAVGVKADDVYLHTASFAFSSSVRQMMLPLSIGAEVVVASAAEIADPLAMFGVIRQHGVTVMDLVPSHWAACIGALQAAAESERQRLLNNRLRLVLSASEALWSDVPRRWRAVAGKATRLINMFGQTETCGIAATYPIPEDLDSESRIVLVGRPIPNTYIYVLDTNRQPVPAGVAGEVYVGGPGVGAGYLGLPELTSERFIADPLRTGGRLYRTGDVGRYTATGELDFLGRQDSQVKIRGHRVELGEIEAVLRRFEGVSEVAVVLRPTKTGDVQVVAYYAAPDRSRAEPAQLREHLRRNLPTYMVPSGFVRLERLPLTPNGKLDRKALPEPQWEEAQTGAECVVPRTETEKALCEMWAGVLGVSRVGMEDNFFDLGGHSLLAVTLFGRIRARFGVELPLASLFQAATVAAMAAMIDQGGYQSRWHYIVPIHAQGSRPPFFCVHGIGGNVVEYHHLAALMPPDQPFIGIQAAGLQGGWKMKCRAEEMAAEYIRELRQFQPQGPYYLGGSSFGGLLAFEMARQLHAMGQRVALLALFDTWGPGYPQRLIAKKRGATRDFLWLLERLQMYASDLHLIPRRERIPYLFEKVRHARAKVGRWVPQQLRRLRRTVEHRLLPKRIKAVEQAGHQAKRFYVPGVYAGKAILFRASKQEHGIRFDESNGLAGMAAGGLEIHVVEGHHGAMILEPQVRFLAPVFCECLKRAQRENEPSIVPSHVDSPVPAT